MASLGELGELGELVRELVRELAVPLGNHLWQSTLFGLAAGCVTLSLRRSEAWLRFRVWLLASLKFLLPFAPLVRGGMLLGAHIGAHVGGSSKASFVSAVEIVSQPFASRASPVHPGPAGWSHFSALLPMTLAAVWLAGTLRVLLVWCVRWLEVLRMKGAAIPLSSGVEVDLLRTIGAETGMATLSVMLCSSHVEPGVFGIFRPVLLWPANLSQELSEPQLRAILAHEVWHVQRRDNLTAAVQMSLEALFWFHPLVWWFGSRQMEERERACDEGVLALGCVPAVYAESILTTCKFCVEAPLPCMAGVSSSHLKKRMTRIMQKQDMNTLSLAKKFVLGTVAIGAMAAPVFFGVVSAPKAGAQASASATLSGPVRITAVKRNTSGSAMTLVKNVGSQTTISNTTARKLIEMVYAMKDYQLTGGPSWIDQDRFDISFTGGSSLGSLDNLSSNAALKEMLAQRFHLVLRQETKPGPVFALIVSDGGAKFSTVKPPNAPGTDEPLLSVRVMAKDGQGQIAMTGGPGGLADALSSQMSRPILDKTGLTGIYSIDFHWTTTASIESLSSDLQQQLGLSLMPQDGPVESSVIESITDPAGS